jgi:5-(carboxyamino)imidazole ribonucleotide synthase
MFVHAAQRMGYFTTVLDPDPLSPAGRVSHHHIQTAYTDPGLQQLSERCVAITTEFENVPAQALAQLAHAAHGVARCRRCGHSPGPRPREVAL